MMRLVVSLSSSAVVALAACAPDAMRSVYGSGFNHYLDTLTTVCPNLRIGTNDIGLWLQHGGGTKNYAYWLDMTSRMYFRRITVAEYQASVAAQIGGGAADAESFACIIDNLPAKR